MVYAPSARVVVLLVTPVTVLVALTVAASRAAPAESRTTPTIRALGVCAFATAPNRLAAIVARLKQRLPRQCMDALLDELARGASRTPSSYAARARLSITHAALEMVPSCSANWLQ